MDYVKFILTVALPALAIAGAAAGYFKANRGDSIIKYQADEIQLRDGTIARLEKEKAALQSENDVLREQNKKLGELAQGSPQLKTLSKAVESLTKTVQLHFRESKA